MLTRTSFLRHSVLSGTAPTHSSMSPSPLSIRCRLVVCAERRGGWTTALSCQNMPRPLDSISHQLGGKEAGHDVLVDELELLGLTFDAYPCEPDEKKDMGRPGEQQVNKQLALAILEVVCRAPTTRPRSRAQLGRLAGWAGLVGVSSRSEGKRDGQSPRPVWLPRPETSPGFHKGRMGHFLRHHPTPNVS